MRRIYHPCTRRNMSLRAGPQRLLRSTPTFRESPFSSSLASASRSFSSTSLRSKSIQDPSHPTGLYYHQVETLSSRSSKPSPSWAISLLPEAPTQLDAASIIAFLRKQTSDPASVARSPDEVVVHEPFWTLLHKTLKEKVVAEDEILIFEAEMRSSGWAHLSGESGAFVRILGEPNRHTGAGRSWGDGSGCQSGVSKALRQLGLPRVRLERRYRFSRCDCRSQANSTLSGLDLLRLC